MDEAELLPETPRKSNLFIKGQSGNPNGRPKGTKNQITVVKAQMEAFLRDEMKEDLQDIVAKVISMAKEGDKEMLKLVWNSWISKAATSDEEPVKEKIQITIGSLPVASQVRTNTTTIDTPPSTTTEDK